METLAKNNYQHLVEKINDIYVATQRVAALTARNWLLGYHIVEFEIYGTDSTKYGEKLTEAIAKSIKTKSIKGLNSRALRDCRNFYLTYPQIWQIVSAKLQCADFQHNNLLPIQPPVFVNAKYAETYEKYLPSELLISRLSFSHFIELIRIDEATERLFYEVETITNNWSAREMKRAIDTSLHLRTVLSKNRESIIRKIKNLKPLSNSEIIRDLYVLDFLGLEEKNEYRETNLEQAILDKIQKFLMELGTGFTFEVRQKRITINNKHYRIDLVFYNRILKCHVLCDLKIGTFRHADAGQMNLYLNYFKKNEMLDGDNPPIGIILCKDKDATLAEYATAGMSENLFVSKYLDKLPDKKELERAVNIIKFTYPVVFIFNEETGFYNGYIPDLALYCDGETLEKTYANTEELMTYYFSLALIHNTEIALPSTLYDIIKKWVGYKVSLITASI
ncbi:hypothetical protein FACS189451_09840 [Bacteroidia bacterium]|nr:hypothetical protein FACS189451_09840 [Bacteroidia bacterium]